MGRHGYKHLWGHGHEAVEDGAVLGELEHLLEEQGALELDGRRCLRVLLVAREGERGGER